MSFRIEFEPSGQDAFDRLPASVRPAVARALLRLAESPYRAVTRPTATPYPGAQQYTTSTPAGGITCLIDVVFRYGQDEETIYVYFVYVEYD
jgi:hypothetical protein